MLLRRKRTQAPATSNGVAQALPPSANGSGASPRGPTEPAVRDAAPSASPTAPAWNWRSPFRRLPKNLRVSIDPLLDNPPEDATKAPLQETRELLRQVESQRRMELTLNLLEAQNLEKKAKEIEKRVAKQRRQREEIERHAARVRRLAPRLGYDAERPITEIPALTEATYTEVEFQTIQEGRSYIRIVYDTASNRYLYEIIEPTLSPTERTVLDFLRDTLVRTLEAHRRRDVGDWNTYLTDAVERAIVDHAILVDEVSKQRVLYYILRDFFGYGPVDVLMRDPMIEDVSCDGPGIPVYLFHRQYESIKSNLVFATERDLDAYVIRLAQRSGKHISIADPLLDATLPDGSRLQATLSKEVTTRGSSFTIRKFRSDPLTPPDLVRVGTMSAELAAYFWLGIEEGASLLFAGGTASGKTTTLNAVSLFIPPDKKIVSIEDTRELNLRHENWIAGLTRSGFGGEIVDGKAAGQIDMYKLLEAALRQRPEYLLVGEVRGPEAMTLFQAMATGHATYSTLHADSVASAVYRLENPPIRIPRIMLETLDAIAIQVQARVNRRLARRIKEVVEVTGFDPRTGDLLTNTVFRWDPATDTLNFLGKSQVFEQIRRANNLTVDQVVAEWTNRTRILRWLIQKGIRRIDDVTKIVSEYYRQPDAVLARVAAEAAAATLAPPDPAPAGPVAVEIVEPPAPEASQPNLPSLAIPVAVAASIAAEERIPVAAAIAAPKDSMPTPPVPVVVIPPEPHAPPASDSLQLNLPPLEIPIVVAASPAPEERIPPAPVEAVPEDSAPTPPVAIPADVLVPPALDPPQPNPPPLEAPMVAGALPASEERIPPAPAQTVPVDSTPASPVPIVSITGDIQTPPASDSPPTSPPTLEIQAALAQSPTWEERIPPVPAEAVPEDVASRSAETASPVPGPGPASEVPLVEPLPAVPTEPAADEPAPPIGPDPPFPMILGTNGHSHVVDLAMPTTDAPQTELPELLVLPGTAGHELPPEGTITDPPPVVPSLEVRRPVEPSP